MEVLRNLFRNFWVCLGLALLGLIALWGAALEGATVWIWIDVFCVVYWVHAAYRTTKPQNIEDVPLTATQMIKVRDITKRFSTEIREVLQEAKDDESNRRKDKETDKKQSSDE